MAFANAKLLALVTTVTDASGATAKVAALLPGLHDAIFHAVNTNCTLTPGQQARLVTVRAELVANAADLQTALGL